MTALQILQEGEGFQAYKGSSIKPIFVSTDIERAYKIAHEAAHMLKNEYHAKRVVLYGSLARKYDFLSTSDIDLAAWGIPDELFFSAVARINTLGSEYEISLRSMSINDYCLFDKKHGEQIDL